MRKLLCITVLLLGGACSQPETTTVQEINPKENQESVNTPPPVADEYGEPKPEPTPEPKKKKKSKSKKNKKAKSPVVHG